MVPETTKVIMLQTVRHIISKKQIGNQNLQIDSSETICKSIEYTEIPYTL